VTEPALLTTWALCGIAAGAARFLPVPLLDDVVRRRAAQTAVVRTLRAHDRRWSAGLAEPLWADAEDARRGVRGRLGAVPGTLLLFPVRKYTALFGAVRGVPNDVARVVLLARAVDRRLERGALTAPDRVPDEARALRQAVDEAIAGMDLRLLTAALADGLSGTRGLTTAAVGLVRERFASSEPASPADAPPVDAPPVEGPLAEGTARVTEVLRRPEVSALLDRFDAQVDARLG
jgi:hypothetical protein